MLAISLSDDGLNFDRCAVIRFIHHVLDKRSEGHGCIPPFSCDGGRPLAYLLGK